MKNQLRRDFQRFLETGGYCTPPGRAMCALQAARTLAEWRDAEDAGLVRLQATPEEENYFDVYGQPEGYTNIYGQRVSAEEERKEIERSIDQQGCWYVFAEVNHGTEGTGDDWQLADGVGMCTGYRNPCSPFENCYVVGMMRAALDAVPQPGNVDELCTSLA